MFLYTDPEHTTCGCVTRWIISFTRSKKSNQYFMNMRRWFLHFFGALFWRKWKFKFLLASMKKYTNFEDPYWNPLPNACFGIQEAACDSVNCSISRKWWWKMLKFLKQVSVLGTFQNQTYEYMNGCRLFQRLNWGFQFSLRCRQSLNLMRLRVKFPELVSDFIEAIRNLKKYPNKKFFKKAPSDVNI